MPCWKKSWRTKQNLGYEKKTLKCDNIDGGEEAHAKKIKWWNVIIVERHDEQNKNLKDNSKWHPKQKKTIKP